MAKSRAPGPFSWLAIFLVVWILVENFALVGEELPCQPMSRSGKHRFSVPVTGVRYAISLSTGDASQRLTIKLFGRDGSQMFERIEFMNHRGPRWMTFRGEWADGYTLQVDQGDSMMLERGGLEVCMLADDRRYLRFFFDRIIKP